MDEQAREDDLRSELVRLATRLTIEKGLEGEARDALGLRARYRSGAGYRNG
jgi:hypothetical protein